MPADDPTPADRAAADPRWLAVITTDDGGTRVVLVGSDRHPIGRRVQLEADAARDEIAGDAVAEAEIDGDGVVRRLRVLPAHAPKAGQLWFAEVRENNARPPAVNLLAFTGAGRPAHSLVAQSDLRSVPVTAADQLGAVRWYPATGEVDQVYVQPAWRRRSIATALVVAAGTLSMVRGWPRLWGDGQRTELGEVWRNSSVWHDRTDQLTHVLPPMTPPDGPPE